MIRLATAVDQSLCLGLLASLTHPPYYPGDSFTILCIENPDWTVFIVDDKEAPAMVVHVVDREQKQIVLLYLLPSTLNPDFMLDFAGRGFVETCKRHPEVEGWPWYPDFSQMPGDVKDAHRYLSVQAQKLNAYDKTAVEIRGVMEHAADFFRVGKTDAELDAFLGAAVAVAVDAEPVADAEPK